MRIALLPLAFLISCGTRTEPRSAVTSAEPAASAEAGPKLVKLGAKAAAMVSVEEARTRAILSTLRLTGRFTTHPESTWRVGAITEGRIVRIFAKLGDRVAAGQVLARMHSHDIHEARSEYLTAKAELARAKSQLNLAERMRDRAARLLDLKAGSQEQLDHAEGELLRAQNALRAAEVNLRRIEAHLLEFLEISPETAEDHQVGEADHDDDLIPVKAPAAGTVIRRDVTVGSVVPAGAELFLIADLARLQLTVQAGEDHLRELRPGAAVRIRTSASETRAYPGRIARIGEEMDPATRTVQVRIDVPNPGAVLKPEGYAEAEIAAGAAVPVLAVPSAAVQEVNGTKVVFVQAAPGEFEVRPVDAAEASDGFTTIRDGLQAGERVAVRGAFLLKSQLLRASLESE
jgi:cobalt-zinc-cadmium efflux system membrane fusion protein